jgi:Ca2+:H+ antiporter
VEGADLNRKWWITANIATILAVLAILTWFLNRQTGQLTVYIIGFALLALIPLAALIGRATERLMEFLGDVSGGLLNATLSNVPELAIGIFLLVHARRVLSDVVAVHADFDIIRGLLLGSVINNILLTLGLAVFLGALRHGRLRFDAGRAAGYASMLALAVVGLALPNLASAFHGDAEDVNAQILVSLFVSGILIVTYVVYIGTQVFHWGERGTAAAEETRAAVAVTAGGHVEHHEHAEHSGHPGHYEHVSEAHLRREKQEEENERNEERERQHHREMRAKYPQRFRLLILVLIVGTGLTVAMAGILVSVTDNVIRDTPLMPLSVGLILFPIVCNLGEIAGAVQSALDRKMEAAMAVAAGSSVQVPLFVAPLLVFISLIIAAGSASHPLTLIFPSEVLIVAGLVTFVYALINLDGETTWLEGLQLLAFYAMVAITAFALPG